MVSNEKKWGPAWGSSYFFEKSNQHLLKEIRANDVCIL